MESTFENKVAIVTGGTRGIGRAVTEALLAAGASVAICGRDEAKLRETVSVLQKNGGRVAGQRADVANADDVRRFFEFVDGEFGGLDILVNNAGVGVFRSVAELTIEDWKKTLETNLSGVFYCCHEALPRFQKRGGGYVINVSSLAGRNPFAGGAAYNASKFGLNGFSEAMMLDHRYESVRVSYVMPGSVDTEFGSHGTGADWKIAPEDVAEIILMLLKMPQRTLVSRVEVRPSKPPKK